MRFKDQWQCKSKATISSLPDVPTDSLCPYRVINTLKTRPGVSVDDFERISEGSLFIAASPASRKLRTQALMMAKVDVPVLIAGEKGSGKKLIGHFIHKLSARSEGRFSTIMCSGQTREQLDLELFGLEETQARIVAGKLELCESGTTLLADIDELPEQLQYKLLRVLQDNQFLRVGGSTPVRANVRIIGTISAEMSQVLADHKIQEDLCNRLSAFTLLVPSLCYRSEEISLLMDYFMMQLARLYSLPPRRFSQEMMSVCQAYTWPGNLEELKSYVKRFLVIGDEELAIDELRRTDAPSDSTTTSVPVPRTGAGSSLGLKSMIQSLKNEAERTAITAALAETRWNRKAAAQLLKVSYRTLLYKIEQYRMTPPGTTDTLLPGTGVRGRGHSN
jgi:two-component system, NtrC family, response regulator AtoC